MTSRILIVGLAREGISLARYFARQNAAVTVTDAGDPNTLAERVDAVGEPAVRYVLGGDHAELVADADRVFVSPGVPEVNPVYRAAEGAGMTIESMTTLFFALCPGPILGITGSSGKTTTTGLVGHILETARRAVTVGGNIGEPMLDLLPRVGPETLVVLELSSFQLSLLRQSPHIAVVTNISPNHLDRHGTMESYVAAKRRIVQFQGLEDYAVLNAGDPEAPGFVAATPAAVCWFGRDERPEPAGVQTTVRGSTIGIRREGNFTPVIARGDIGLRGEHNVENVLAAVAVGAILGIEPEEMAQAARTFRPAPHRLQTVAELRGVRYIDDSIATSPARAMVALRSFQEPVLLIAGGRDKHLPWEAFAAAVVQRVQALLLIGESAPLIEAAVRAELARRQASGERGQLSPDAIVRCRSLRDAVSTAGRLAAPGAIVLLSPACASYDQFANFEERGAVFARAVEMLHAA